MTETQFRNLLKKLDEQFRPSQIGSNKGEWLTVGNLIKDSVQNDLDIILKKEEIYYSIKNNNGDLYLRVKDGKDNVILKIPTIPRIHWILFLLTVFTTLLAGAMMEGARIWEYPIEILKGIPFSVTLMLILGTHEFGHYFGNIPLKY